MTIDEFLVELRKTPRDWEVRSHGGIRRLHTGHSIADTSMSVECPLSSIANYPLREYREAANIKHICMDDMLKIVYSADNRVTMKGFDFVLRQQILEACGLPHE